MSCQETARFAIGVALGVIFAGYEWIDCLLVATLLGWHPGGAGRLHLHLAVLIGCNFGCCFQLLQ